MIFQEPMTSLSPVHTIGSQLAEVAMLHQGASKSEAFDRAREMLARVGIANPGQRLYEYPHNFSGGMRQRAMIAMALMCNPRLLIADEPTTALDVTVQAQILELLKELQQQFGMAILMITHNLGVIAELAHRVAVMYMGKVVETSDATTVFDDPLHPYTVGLLRSMPQAGQRRESASGGDSWQRAGPVQHSARVQLLSTLRGAQEAGVPGAGVRSAHGGPAGSLRAVHALPVTNGAVPRASPSRGARPQEVLPYSARTDAARRRARQGRRRGELLNSRR